MPDPSCLQIEHLAPYYAARSLAFFPEATPFESLTVGLDAVMRQIPSGDPSSVLVVRKVTERVLQLAGGPSQDPHLLQLYGLLGYLLLVIDFEVRCFSRFMCPSKLA